MEETSSILNLTQLGLADEGNYSCVGVNSQGEGQTDNILLEVTGCYPYENFFAPSISAPPRFLQSLPEMTTLVEGEDVEFLCQVRGLGFKQYLTIIFLGSG